MSGKRIAIALLRNDLRYLDNEVLHMAHSSSDFVVPLYCLDPRHFQTTYHFGFPKTGAHRARFLLHSLEDLRAQLTKHGSDLVIREGRPESAVPDLLSSLSGHRLSLVLQQEATDEELRVERALADACRRLSVPVHTVWGATLYHRDDLPFKVQSVPDVYTQFRQAVESRASVRAPLTMPDRLRPLPAGVAPGPLPAPAALGLPDGPPPAPDARSAFPWRGGEAAALDRLRHYLWQTDAVATYKETRNGLVGADYSTKFSPWLALGCLSPRHIHSEVRRYEAERTANKSTYWVLFELIWRDYFRFVALKFGNRIFFETGLLNKKVPWQNNKVAFDQWKDGATGVPFVDANMRELKLTGWMSNRGRQNVASFLTKDLGLDWRLGAEWFESLLLDHDVCSNYGNWNYSAGIGNDPRENRKFNMIKQATDYDPQGEYVRLWVPELASVKDGRVHMPWALPPAARRQLEYPDPMVVAPEWQRHASKTAPGRGRGRGGPQPGRGQRRGIDFYFSSSASGDRRH
ncbi:cryptochrome DASH-like [Pollicipes pollicipes]|uniref:cryptochrome DASH-like n=1 Tax=Pollicipes pollicipes TaxID=41117 RepID=UPI0018851335|nr:cryptochrome DASH-like [Pollicipes pollicipes]XP_037083146.1 cryptochrome DASH-like [Pollicipes pollicipes]XP_037083155.1 cryptochrome DASH-like [Pollicipes pollicipes]